ncbi:hypothetical protein Mapa_009260 [Marchantia paleacea]|nr:hypothetical protein Mapa_009260 [Marchantia paleacea]
MHSVHFGSENPIFSISEPHLSIIPCFVELVLTDVFAIWKSEIRHKLFRENKLLSSPVN